MGHGLTCFDFNEHFMKGVSVYVSKQEKNNTVVISNSLFEGLNDTAILVESNYIALKSTFILRSCIFSSICGANKPVVRVKLSDYNKFISFNNCTF